MLLTAESPLSKLQNGIFRKPICHAFLTTDDADAIGDTPDDQILLNTDYADLHGCATRKHLMTWWFPRKTSKTLPSISKLSLSVRRWCCPSEASFHAHPHRHTRHCMPREIDKRKTEKTHCLLTCISAGVFQRSGVFLPEGVASRRMACAVRQRRGGSAYLEIIK